MNARKGSRQDKKIYDTIHNHANVHSFVINGMRSKKKKSKNIHSISVISMQQPATNQNTCKQRTNTNTNTNTNTTLQNLWDRSLHSEFPTF